MTRNDYKIDNNGNNQGLIVGENKGNIEISIQKAVRIPSLISAIVKSLGEACSNDDFKSTFDAKEYKPDEKIEYNCVLKYKDIIKYFSTYCSICEEYLNAYDDSNMRGKTKILNCVYSWYMEDKGTVLLANKDSGKNDIDIIRENSDEIIDMVRNRIFKAVNPENMYLEDMELGVKCFTCYCFMECKILEKPS